VILSDGTVMGHLTLSGRPMFLEAVPCSLGLAGRMGVHTLGHHYVTPCDADNDRLLRDLRPVFRHPLDLAPGALPLPLMPMCTAGLKAHSGAGLAANLNSTLALVAARSSNANGAESEPPASPCSVTIGRQPD